MTQGLKPGTVQRSSDLKEVRRWDGTPIPAGMQARLVREFARLELVDRQIAELEQERVRHLREVNNERNGKIRKLMRLRGIGINCASVYVREVFGWRKLRNRRQVGALFSLTPMPYGSGDDQREQGISKAGNPRLRSLAVEIAWLWLRYQGQSELSQWYWCRFGMGNSRVRRIGIVALARKVVVALWKYLEFDELPAGAQLKDIEPIPRTRRKKSTAHVS